MDKARNLGLALIALGFVELAWVAFCLFGGALLGVFGLVESDVGPLMFGLAGVYGVLAVGNVPLALLHIYGGLQLRRGRGLIVAFASLAACLVSLVFALYCSPLTLMVLVYGIVVLVDPEVRDVLDGRAPTLV